MALKDLKECCQRAAFDLAKAGEYAGMMAVHECYSPHLFHNATMRCEIIESHLRYCGGLSREDINRIIEEAR